MVRKGVFIVRLSDKVARDNACEMSGILFDKKPFMVKPWKANMSLEKEALFTISTWVHLPALPMVYRGEKCIRKIDGLLGNVIKIDHATKNKDRLMYARALVEMDFRNGLSDEVFFTNEYDELVKQPVKYDWKPLWCHKCQQLGPQSSACKPKETLNPIHKKPPRREWVKKGSQQDHTKAQTNHHENCEFHEIMAIQPPEGNLQSKSQCTMTTVSRGESF